MCVCLCQSLPTNSSTLLSLLAHTQHADTSETDRREQFRLPVPAPSVKLIRLQLQDNSIISGSSTTENPSKLQKLQWCNITEHYCIPEFTRVWAESTGTMPSGQSSSQCLRYTVVKTKRRNGVAAVFLSCLAPILYVSQRISGAVLLNIKLREAKFTTKHCIVNTHLVILLISLRRSCLLKIHTLKWSN